MPESDEMKQAAKSYYDSQDFISDFISEHCTRGRNLFISRKEFLKRLQEEFPKETRGLSDRSLTSMIEKIDGVSYNPRAGRKCSATFFGIGWNDSSEQQDLDDNFCPPPNM